MTGKSPLNKITSALLLALSLFVTSCQQTIKLDRKAYTDFSKEDHGNTKYQGHYKIGKKYQIKDAGYTPREVKYYSQVGIASWYGANDGFHGKRTANGDLYNKNLLTAAHRTLQLPSLVKVTNLGNKKSVVVLVNDRGPYKHGRIIDLSEKAAEVIGMKNQGVAKVRIKYLHADSQQFLNDMGLHKKHGHRSTRKVHNHQCSINCHIKVANLKHGIKLNKG